MKKMINRINIEGILYEENLKMSEKQYVNGKLSILTSEPKGEITNVCEMKVIAGHKYGNKSDAKVNPNFAIFKSLMESENSNSYLTVGEEAIGVQISGSIGTNYFTPQGVEIKRENVISPMVNNASFITIIDKSLIKEPKAEFETDIVITHIIPEMTKETEDNPSIETGNYLVKGYIFDYKNHAIEVTYIAKASEDGSMSAADYFSSLEGELPIFTKVWGNINCFITKESKVEPSAFGKPKEVSFTSTKKEYEITGALSSPYEDGLTEEEFKSALQSREQDIAIALDNQKNRGNNTSTPNTFTNSGNNDLNAIANAFSGFNVSSGEKFTY